MIDIYWVIPIVISCWFVGYLLAAFFYNCFLPTLQDRKNKKKTTLLPDGKGGHRAFTGIYIPTQGDN